LKAVSRHGATVNDVDLEAATRGRVAVAFTPSVNEIGVAEQTMVLMLTLLRKIPQDNLSLNPRNGKG
jgi:phosphoglycerate dehydrogenase-like enzyme